MPGMASVTCFYSAPHKGHQLLQSCPEHRLVWGPPYKTSDVERAARGAFCRDLLSVGDGNQRV